ncbi:MAG TPA: phosphoenolpyruvate--protein phosphotransferase [Mucilaginibacter sp.]|jgi:phosphotransferase system enzyme I (PtsI)
MKGIGVSPGISINKAFVIRKTQAALSGISLKNEEEIAAEIARFKTAVKISSDEIEHIKNNSQTQLQKEELDILDVQLELINDPQIADDVIDKITTEKKTANDALLEIIDNIVQIFLGMDDNYMSERSADIKDIGARILKHINDPGRANIQKFDSDVIIIADDISPSETMTMDVAHVTGFATRSGSKTSHAAIIARAKGIPAVVNCGEELMTIKDKDIIILDGELGVVLVNPGTDKIREYERRKDIYKQQTATLKSLKDTPSITTDGKEIILSANISSAADMDQVFENGGAGVGLLRTELLFMNRDSFPTEEEQFKFYKEIAVRSNGKPVIVRTIDIGGDKHLPYFNLPPELNPFLGYRAIRICLDRTDLFKTQLKAILRAGIFGDLKIMFPMISGVKEIRDAKKILEEAKGELATEDNPFNAEIKIGIMIEIPSAAVTADILAKEVDFFSIGTNDLCQYTLAVDRMNEKITHLYDPFNPGVLRLIYNVIEQGRIHNTHVAMCGEMAADPLATLVLIGMGLEEFSMSATAIPVIKNIIINSTEIFAKQVCSSVLEMDSSENIITYLKQLTQ